MHQQNHDHHYLLVTVICRCFHRTLDQALLMLHIWAVFYSYKMTFSYSGLRHVMMNWELSVALMMNSLKGNENWKQPWPICVWICCCWTFPCLKSASLPDCCKVRALFWLTCPTGVDANNNYNRTACHSFHHGWILPSVLSSLLSRAKPVCQNVLLWKMASLFLCFIGFFFLPCWI